MLNSHITSLFTLLLTVASLSIAQDSSECYDYFHKCHASKKRMMAIKRSREDADQELYTKLAKLCPLTVGDCKPPPAKQMDNGEF